MSGPVPVPQRTHRQPLFGLARPLVSGVILGGLLALLALLATDGPAKAQDKTPDKTPENPTENPAEKIDNQPPLPPVVPKRAVPPEKFLVPNKDRAIFKGRKDPKTGKIDGGIQDFTPVASETENPDEYAAWTELVQHAKGFTAADLEANAARDLTRDDLLEQTRFGFRLDLVRLDGKLTKVRRVPATQELQRAGTAEVYEVLLVPIDDPPTDVVSVVVTELPEPLAAAVKQKPAYEWVDANLWAVAAGYFFKIKKDTRDADPVPILIGKSVSVQKGPPGPPAGSVIVGDKKADDPTVPTAIDKGLRVFTQIRDDAKIAKIEENWAEVAAWNRVLLHARRFSAEELEKHARDDLKFASLFEPVRRDYKLDLVKFEGRLIMLSKMKPSAKLAAAGVETAYEGWLVPQTEPSGNPICIVFTDLPEGIEPVGRVNKWVSFAGYSFKLLRYESAEKDKNEKNVTKRAPLLLGRAVILRRDPDVGSVGSGWDEFATLVTIVVVLLVGSGLAVGWWFRRGDRQSQQEIATHRARNPFTGQTDAPDKN